MLAHWHEIANRGWSVAFARKQLQSLSTNCGSNNAQLVMSKPLYEDDILLAVARAQGVLYRAAMQMLKRDKYDGLRAVKWLEKHNELYRELADEDCMSDEVVAQARKLAGDPEQ